MRISSVATSLFDRDVLTKALWNVSIGHTLTVIILSTRLLRRSCLLAWCWRRVTASAVAQGCCATCRHDVNGGRK